MLASTASFINCTGGVNGDNPTEITRSDVDTVVRALLNNNAYTIMDNIEGEDKFGTASGSLLQQIIKGAPVDVFASADQETMSQAEQAGCVKNGDQKIFASNQLVVIVPKGSKQNPTGLSDLTKSQYQKIAIGLPASVPVGRYTKLALEKKNLWGVLESKMISAQSVRQALDYVARSEVDAGFVYSTDAVILPNEVTQAFVVPVDLPILYPIAPINGSPNNILANKFVAFVVSPQGREILSSHGFGKP